MADILSMHEEMLDDPELHHAAIDAIREGRSAEAGWWNAIETAAHAQEMLADRLLAERAADLRDVGRRVLGVLCDVQLPEPPDHPYILVMDDMALPTLPAWIPHGYADCLPCAAAPPHTVLFWLVHWAFPQLSVLVKP